MPTRRAPDFIPSFEDRLAEFLATLGQSLGTYGESQRKQEQQGFERENTLLQRLLGIQQFEAQGEERALRHKEFGLKQAESQRAAQERERVARAALAEKQREAQFIKALEPSMVTQQGEQEPSEFGGPGVGEGGTTRVPFLQALGRRPSIREAMSASGYLPKDALNEMVKGELELRKPLQGGPGTEFIDPTTRQPFYKVSPEPKEPPAPTAARDFHAIARKQLGTNASPEDISERARMLSEAAETRVAATSAAAVERARLDVPNPMDADMRKQWMGITDSVGRLDTMTELLGSGKVNLKKIAGGIAPWVNEIVQTGRVGLPLIGEFPVPEALLPSLTREEYQFLSSLHDYADLVLRQRSGAQINEQEFKRMLTFLAHPGVRAEVIIERLALQDQRLEQSMKTVEHLLTSQRSIVPPRMPRSTPKSPKSQSQAIPPGLHR